MYYSLSKDGKKFYSLLHFTYLLTLTIMIKKSTQDQNVG